LGRIGLVEKPHPIVDRSGEETFGIQIRVPKELENGAVEPISAEPGHGVNQPTAVAGILRVRVVELRQGEEEIGHFAVPHDRKGIQCPDGGGCGYAWRAPASTIFS
jgi:hypothetical protein